MRYNHEQKCWSMSSEELGLFLYYLMCGYQYMVENMPHRAQDAERLKKWIEQAEQRIVQEKKRT